MPIISSILTKDYYDVLGLARSCSQDDIKQSYRKLALKNHPQKSTLSQNQKLFMEVSEAYHVLSNYKLKAIYDLYGIDGLLQGVVDEETGERYEGGFQFNSDKALVIFQTFFGTDNVYEAVFAPGSNTKVGTIIQAVDTLDNEDTHPLKVTVRLDELYNGSFRDLKYVKKIYGSDGCVLDEQEKKIRMNIKKGWKNGTRVIFPKEGHELANGIRKDIVFEVDTEADSRFIRKGDDLHLTQVIPLKSALTSSSLSIKTMDGRTLSIIISEIISPSFVKVLTGEGMPKCKTPEERGDMYIHFDIQFPSYLNSQQKKLIEEALK